MEMRPLLHELTAGCRRPCLSPVVRAECGSAGRAQAEGRGVGVGGEAWESGGGGGGGGGGSGGDGVVAKDGARRVTPRQHFLTMPHHLHQSAKSKLSISHRPTQPLPDSPSPYPEAFLQQPPLTASPIPHSPSCQSYFT